MNRLDIGCGREVETGWTGVDPMADSPGIQRPAWDLPFDDGAVDEIRCIHALEHFPPEHLYHTAAEWARVLRPGGRLTVVVPDAAYVLQFYLDNPRLPWAKTLVFGRKLYEGDAHRTAWSQERLRRLFSPGFVVTLSTAWDQFHRQDSITLKGARRP